MQCDPIMGFKPSKAEDKIWMRKVVSIYEYISGYVDDLAISSQDPSAKVEELTTKHKMILKGSLPIAYHLGADFYGDKDGVLCKAAENLLQECLVPMSLCLVLNPNKQ